VQEFSQQLLHWFDQHGRKSLPWQHPRSPYFVWLSEIMLQQTQVSTVIPYFLKFIRRFPDVFALAQASQDEVLTYWAGLGYYSRARNLHKAAQMVVAEYQGEFPANLEALQKLPGIGRSTAGAILAQAFNRFGVILDGNVKRVLSRFYAVHDEKLLWQHATENTPHQRLPDYSQAMMDLGALICMRTKPKCLQCPFQENCIAYRTNSIGKYPAKKVSKALPIKESFFLLMTNEQNEILLEQQPSPGIWGGLWSLPSTMALEASIYFNQAKITARLPAFTHTFTHFKLQLKPVKLQIEAGAIKVSEALNQRWVAPNQLGNFALPAPIKKLLSKAFEAR
jgi:A/G-specific adenine glycosylase